MTTKLRTHVAIAALAPPAEGKRRVAYHDSPNLKIEMERLPSGTVRRYWRYDYCFAGRRTQLCLGSFPEVGAGTARTLRDRYNALVTAGVDPKHRRIAAEKQHARELTTLAEASAGFLADIGKLGHVRESSINRYTRNHTAIERATIGKLPIGALSGDVQTVKEWLLGHAPSQARTLCQYLARVFTWAIMHGACSGNPAKALAEARWMPAHEQEHYRAVTDPAQVGELLRAIRGDVSDVARIATEFLALTLVRPSNVWEAQWVHIDMDQALWTIPAEAMKKDRDHVVPLTRQAMAILRAMFPITGSLRYVFSTTGNPLSRQTFTLLAQRIGWADRHVAHGFRAMASTILHGESEHAFRPGDLNAYRAIEEQLAHANSLAELSGISARSSGPYDRNKMMAIRTELMVWWADRLDMMRTQLRVVEAAA
jgi:integrase